MMNLLAQSLESLPKREREKLESLALVAKYRWTLQARPSQLPPPGDWRVWLIQAGRGYGKTRVLVEWARSQIEAGRYRRMAFIARTPSDVRDVLIEGESGILEKSPPWFRPKWEPTRRRLTWPNGAIATTYSAENPDELRGPQHDGAICDELATWRYPEAWDNLMLGLRLGTDPRVVVGTTPKPVRLLKAVRALPTCVITSGATYENVDNLAPAFREHIISRYEGTRLGRQELGGELIEDNPAALWKREQLEAGRVLKAPDLVRVVVGVDPAISAKDESDETGIIVAGKGADGHAYVLDDLSLRASPDGWARAAVTAYHRNSADRIVAEVNQGGDMVENTVRTVDRNVAYSAVHASRGKYSRAEPIAALYEQGKVHHVGTFAELEDQQCQWVPGDKSPDRLDALVWAITALGLTARAPGKAETFRR